LVQGIYYRMRDWYARKPLLYIASYGLFYGTRNVLLRFQ
jgi:hypothetical protein